MLLTLFPPFSPARPQKIGLGIREWLAGRGKTDPTPATISWSGRKSNSSCPNQLPFSSLGTSAQQSLPLSLKSRLQKRGVLLSQNNRSLVRLPGYKIINRRHLPAAAWQTSSCGGLKAQRPARTLPRPDFSPSSLAATGPTLPPVPAPLSQLPWPCPEK